MAGTCRGPLPSRVPLAIAAHRHPFPLDRRPAESVDDAVGDLVGYLDEGEAIGDLDRADRPRIDARLVHDGPDQIGRPDVGLAARPDVEPHHIAVRRNRVALAAARLLAVSLRAPLRRTTL